MRIERKARMTTAETNAEEENTVSQPAARVGSEPNQFSLEQHSADRASADRVSPNQVSIDQGPIDQGSIDQVSIGQLSIDQGSIDQVSIGQFSIDQGSIDRVSIDQASIDQARASWLAAETSPAEIRSERLAAIQRAIANGTYQTTPEQTAEAILSEQQIRSGTAA
jgi:anti-sigma28 factor (negative regulator of flagellin synthesis)